MSTDKALCNRNCCNMACGLNSKHLFNSKVIPSHHRFENYEDCEKHIEAGDNIASLFAIDNKARIA